MANEVIIRLGLQGASQVEAGIRQVANTLSQIKGAALGLTAAIGAFSGLSKIEGSIHAVVELGTELTRLKAQTGATIPQLIVIRKVLKETGGDADSAATFISRMQRVIADAATGELPDAERAFARLGLSMEELQKKGPAEQLGIISQRIDGLVDRTERAAAVTAIFGKSGALLLPAFKDGKLFDELAKGAGTFGEVMARNSELLHEFEVVTGRVKSSGTKFFAGVLDQLPIHEITEAIESALKAVDFTTLGQRFGAFVAVAIEQWKEGRFGEFVSLSIEAGFEAGTNAARKLWDQLTGYIGSQRTWQAISLNVLTVFNAIGEAMSQLVVSFVQLVNLALIKIGSDWKALFQTLFSLLRDGFAVVVNFFAENLETVANQAISRINNLFGSKFGNVSLGRAAGSEPGQVAEPVTWAKAWELAAESVKDLRAGLTDFFRESTEAGRVLLGVNQQLAGEQQKEGTALERLTALIKQQLEAREKLAAAAKTEVATTTSYLPTANLIAKLRKEEIDLRQQLVALEAKRADIETDFTQTQVQKWAQRKAILEQERDLQQKIIDILRERATQPGLSQQERDQLAGQANTAESRVTAVGRQIGGLGPDPTSFSDQWSAALTKLQDQFGTVAQNIAQTFNDVISGSINTISTQLTNVIIGTESWANALRGIGTTILQSIIQGIIQIGLKWVANLILGTAATTASIAVQTAVIGGFAAAASALLTTPALLATVASYGTAAVLAPGELAAAIAAAKGITAVGSLAGYERGGFTGNLPTNQAAGTVHGKEFVFSAPATSAIGVQTLSAMHNAALNGAGSGGSPNVNVGGAVVHNIILPDRAAMRQYIRSRQGTDDILNVISENRTRLGLVV